MIYIDADAIPTVAKELVVKTANRTQITAVFVANRKIALPPSLYVRCHVVAQGFDVADDFIATSVCANDIVVTSDIALAFEVLAKDAMALDARGEIYSPDTIAQKRNMRDFMDTLRGSDILQPTQMGQQKPYDEKDKKHFADSLNRLIDKMYKKHPNRISKTNKNGA